MDHIPGGRYTSSRKPCRCSSCRAQHAADAADYQRRHPQYRAGQIERLKLQVAELKAWQQNVLAATGEKASA